MQSARETWGDIVADTLGHWLKVRKLRPDKGVGIEDRVALDFAAQQADDLRHIAEGNKWMHWDGGCWREEKTLAPYDIARKLCRAAGDARARTVAGSISLARSDRRLVATTEQWDTDAMLLQSTGMTIDLRTGTAFSPLRSNYMTKRTVCDLAPPGTPHPRWSDFLRVVTQADETLIAFLKRLSGYCLTGLTREHKFGFFHGPGGNGKGVYLNALKAVMGDYAIAAPMEMFLLSKFERHPTEIAQLKGIRLVIAQEPQKGRRWDETKLKTLTSSDPLRGRFMRQDLFGFDPTHKLMLAANYKPSLYAVNEAIRRRLMLILFRAVIANPDPEFGEKLVPEYPAILRWMVDGCVEWQRSGLIVPASVVAASEQYFVNEDDIEQWLDDCVDRSDPRAFTTSRVLYMSRKIWCEARGLSPGTERAFVDELADNKGFEQKRTNAGRGFVGLKLYANDLGPSGGGGGGKPAGDDGDDEPPPLMPCSYCGRADGTVYQMNDIRRFNPLNPPQHAPSVYLHEACTQQFFAQASGGSERPLPGKPADGLQILGQDNHACVQCNVNDGEVYLIRNKLGEDTSAKPLHEQCAPFFFKLR